MFLLVPMYDSEGTLWNAQLIDAAGTTDFLKPGRITGCFFVIGKSGARFTKSGINPIGLNLICQGYATGATCFAAMDVPVVVAFTSDNLQPVAKACMPRIQRRDSLFAGMTTGRRKTPTASRSILGGPMPSMPPTRPAQKSRFLF